MGTDDGGQALERNQRCRRCHHKSELQIEHGRYSCTHQHDEENDQLYEDICTIQDTLTCHNTIIMGDFNAKVLKQKQERNAVGQHGQGERNENGEIDRICHREQFKYHEHTS